MSLIIFLEHILNRITACGFLNFAWRPLDIFFLLRKDEQEEKYLSTTFKVLIYQYKPPQTTIIKLTAFLGPT